MKAPFLIGRILFGGYFLYNGTFKSFLGMLNLRTPSGCTVPERPIASSAVFQSEAIAAFIFAGLVFCARAS